MATTATTKATKATTTPATKAGPYRSNAAWFAAHAAAVGAQRTHATHKATCTVLTHLAWRAPSGTVGWNKGTNASMVAHAASLGIVPGMPVAKAVAVAVAALPAHATTAALHAATVALAPGK